MGFEKIYCINLARRKDRWEQCLVEFAKQDLTVERIEAVDMPGNPVLGCLKSHEKALRSVVDGNYANALILEDDIEFSGSINISGAPKWDMLYLGGSHIAYPVVIGGYGKVTHTKSTCAYAVTQEMAKALLSWIGNNRSIPIDEIYCKIQRAYACYCLSPLIAWQRPGYSDIEKQFVDYTHIQKK